MLSRILLTSTYIHPFPTRSWCTPYMVNNKILSFVAGNVAPWLSISVLSQRVPQPYLNEGSALQATTFNSPIRTIRCTWGFVCFLFYSMNSHLIGIRLWSSYPLLISLILPRLKLHDGCLKPSDEFLFSQGIAGRSSIKKTPKAASGEQ